MATKTDTSYGVIPFYKEEDGLKVFLIHQYGINDIFWSFPKGHPEDSESPQETALRELMEETGLQAELLKEPVLHQSYWFMYKGDRIEKFVEYFIGFTSDQKFTIQEEELESAGWFTPDEAMEQLTHDVAKETLREALIALQHIEEVS